MSSLLDTNQLLSTSGAIGIFVILFVETGLPIGFLLPGDTLLLGAGLLAGTPATAAAHLDLQSVLVAAGAGALAGAQVGYLIGRLAGPRLFSGSEGSRRVAGLRRSRDLLDRYGHGRAIVLARFVPLVRTLMNPLAGAVGVPARRFALWQAAGGLLWSLGLVLLGYVVGSRVPDIEAYLVPAVAVAVVATVAPLLVRGLRARRSG